MHFNNVDKLSVSIAKLIAILGPNLEVAGLVTNTKV